MHKSKFQTVEKIKKELTRITEKHESVVNAKLNKINKTDSYWEKMEILLESRNSHHKEITNYTIEHVSDLDNSETYNIEIIKRSSLSRFDDFLRHVPV